MKEEKVRCTRCPAEISVSAETAVEEARRLGWRDFCHDRIVHMGALNSFILCTNCVHELKRLLDGGEVWFGKKL